MKFVKCVICNKEIKPLYPDVSSTEEPEKGMWDGGIVDKFYMPYGSRLDGDVYVIGLCDDCIEHKQKIGIIIKK